MSDRLKIAACYIRVSTDDQLEYSPDSQLSAIQRYAKQNGYILPEEYIFVEQEGRSGRNADKRPQFQRMIGTAKLKPKPFDVVLLWKFSRFARNREDSIVYKSMLRKQLGIEVISISENVGDDKMSVIFEAMIEAMDEYYSINLAEEVKRGMIEKVSRGEAVSIAPFGYILKDKKLIIDPEKADIVRTVFQKYLDGQGLRAIASWLNSIGVQTRRGNMLENRTVEYWLNNPVYHGYIRWTPTGRTRRDYHNPESMIVKGTHAAIISDEVWDAVQAKLTAQKEKYRKYRRPDPSNTFALSGIVRCAACGATIVKTSNGYMHCTQYSRGACKHSQSTPIKIMTEAIQAALSNDYINFSFPTAPSENGNADSSAKSIIETQLFRERQKLDRAKQAYLSGIDTEQEYKDNKTAISEEITRLSKELDRLNAPKQTEEHQSDIRERCKTALDLLASDEATPQEKNAALKNLIDKVVYSRDNATLQIYYL